jgi:hypothetical protein
MGICGIRMGELRRPGPPLGWLALRGFIRFPFTPYVSFDWIGGFH